MMVQTPYGMAAAYPPYAMSFQGVPYAPAQQGYPMGYQQIYQGYTYPNAPILPGQQQQISAGGAQQQQQQQNPTGAGATGGAGGLNVGVQPYMPQMYQLPQQQQQHMPSGGVAAGEQLQGAPAVIDPTPGVVEVNKKQQHGGGVQ
ncbi:unnamed protein product [Ectocarpus fasciculatus]